MPRFAFIPSNAVASLTLLLTCSWISARGAEEIFCENDPQCSPERMLVTFPDAEPAGASELEIFQWDSSVEVHAQISIDVENSRVQGWSYGVAHDPARLQILPDSVTTSGTIVDTDHPDSVVVEPHFDSTTFVSGGFISAVVLSFLSKTQLPIGQRSAVASARYLTRESPGSWGTAIRLVDGRLGTEGSNFTHIAIQIDGEARFPHELVHGIVYDAEIGNPRGFEFRRGDVDGDGRYTVSDVFLTIRTILGIIPARFDCDDVLDTNDDGKNDISDALPVIQYLFVSGPPLAGPFSTCGLDVTQDGLSCIDSPGCD